jgi:hypothetical protein
MNSPRLHRDRISAPHGSWRIRIAVIEVHTQLSVPPVLHRVLFSAGAERTVCARVRATSVMGEHARQSWVVYLGALAWNTVVFSGRRNGSVRSGTSEALPFILGTAST